MTDPEPYSPQLRTAVVFSGAGTAGAYHAGVLRALTEAGVKIDLVAGRGMGALAAVFAAIDGGQKLWGENAFWDSDAVSRLYGWRASLKLAVWALAASLALVVVPLAAVALGAIVFPFDFVIRMVGLGGASGLVGAYMRLADRLFAPAALPTWLPRLIVIVLGLAASTIAAETVVTIVSSNRRRERGGLWWRGVRAPLSSREVLSRAWTSMWDLVQGGAQTKQPTPSDLSGRYIDLLSDNVGQPGFRELVITAHDLDARRDLVFALVEEHRRRDMIRRASTADADVRRAEVVDLSGAGRRHAADAVAGALAVPVVNDPHHMTFAPDAYWRGETHRLCDRPGALSRLIDELTELGVEQMIVVSAAASVDGPHALAAGRLDGRGRVGEYLSAAEASAVRDALQFAAVRIPRVFTIQPEHNPIGPFDFGGEYDDRSDRVQPLPELLNRGYEDAYRLFIEPVVGASGERVGLT
ncbi:MAG TPA: patatin-like phospholipase family protein [Vicinamibacterales bacterium]|nr:patatin-like phospholipase family protein [Vicinamibacterales bacterium]